MNKYKGDGERVQNHNDRVKPLLIVLLHFSRDFTFLKENEVSIRTQEANQNELKCKELQSRITSLEREQSQLFQAQTNCMESDMVWNKRLQQIQQNLDLTKQTNQRLEDRNKELEQQINRLNCELHQASENLEKEKMDHQKIMQKREDLECHLRSEAQFVQVQAK